MHDFMAYDTTLTTTYDEEFSSALSALAKDEGFPAGTSGQRDRKLDHATYIPLWFIDKYYSGYKTVRIGLSGFGPVEHYHLGQLIARCVEELGREAVYIASGDLSHKLKEDGPYGFAPEGPRFDEQITQAFAKGDFLRLLTFEESFADKAAECGLRSFQIMAGALDGKAIEPQLLSYEGPFGVGYGIASFHVTGEDDRRKFADAYQSQQQAHIDKMREKEDAYIQLARNTIESFVKTGRAPEPNLSELPDEMATQRAGAFVSLHKHGHLRGCIGTTSAVMRNIAEEIAHNAVSACSEDPRFDPVEEHELSELEISVDILSEAEPISSKDELDVKRYGVIVSKGFKRGLLLPNLDGVDTVDEQIEIAKRKAGIGVYEECKLQRFEVVRHEVIL